MLENTNITKYADFISRFADDKLGVVAVLLNSQGTVKDCNDAFLRLAGEEKKPIGKPFSQYLRDPWELEDRLGSSEFQILLAPQLKIPYALHGVVYSVHQGHLLLATRAITADDTILDKISMLSNEMSALTRELSKKNIALEKANERINNLLRTDTLTGIANRRYFYETLQRFFSYAARHHVPLSLVMADLDHFKKVNDTYGHKTGDQVLVAFARLLQESCRDEDLAARFGGEEFITVLIQATEEDAVRFAQRVCQQVPQMQLSDIDWAITASFGVAQMMDHDTLDDLINRADEAMYRAKKKGRNRVEV